MILFLGCKLESCVLESEIEGLPSKAVGNLGIGVVFLSQCKPLKNSRGEVWEKQKTKCCISPMYYIKYNRILSTNYRVKIEEYI